MEESTELPQVVIHSPEEERFKTAVQSFPKGSKGIKVSHKRACPGNCIETTTAEDNAKMSMERWEKAESEKKVLQEQNRFLAEELQKVEMHIKRPKPDGFAWTLLLFFFISGMVSRLVYYVWVG